MTLSSKIGARRLATALRILAVVLPDLLLPARHLPRALHHGAGQFLVGHLDVVLLADLGDDETEPHAALGDAAVLFLRLLFGRVFVGEGALLRREVVIDRSSRRC